MRGDLVQHVVQVVSQAGQGRDMRAWSEEAILLAAQYAKKEEREQTSVQRPAGRGEKKSS
jgi:hypothetical protein